MNVYAARICSWCPPLDFNLFVTHVMSSPIAALPDLLYDLPVCQLCSLTCTAKGKKYAGTQYGNECWCGDVGTDYDALGSATCDVPCSGDATKFCGGSFALTVYELGEPFRAGWDNVYQLLMCSMCLHTTVGGTECPVFTILCDHLPFTHAKFHSPIRPSLPVQMTPPHATLTSTTPALGST